MCGIMGSKPSGLVFDYLKNEEFKNIKIMDKRVLNEEQAYKLHRARCTYNSRLKRIAGDIGVEKLTSHVSRHSFAYYMLSSGATVEEISHALLHSSIEQTQNYLKQFPSKYSDNAIERFGDGFEIG
jgi:site-specific recombinase XerD